MRDHWGKDRDLKFALVTAEAAGLGLTIGEVKRKPWGGYVRFHRSSLDVFRRAFWQVGLSRHWEEALSAVWQSVAERRDELPLDAKLLLLAPGQRLSLQSHARRSELWRVIEGPILMVMGESEEELTDHEVRAGEVVRIPCNRLHRAAAPPSVWGVVAEFWQHEDPSLPSSESDVVRYADDYDRGEERNGVV